MSFNLISKAKVLGLVGAAALSLTLVAPALADNTVTTSVAPGTYSAIVTDLNLGSSTLDFTAAGSKSGNLTLTVEDARDTGAGWNVTIASSAFTHSDTVTTFANSNFSLSTPNAPVATGTGSQAVSATGGEGPNLVGTGGVLSGSIEVIDAGVGFGKGAYTQSIPTSLNIPAGTKTGTYSATLTVTISSGPGA